MTTMNPKGKKGSTKTSNFAGGDAYKLSDELELYSLVCGSIILKDSFYESEVDKISRLRKLIEKVDPVFVAQLAIYARENMYARDLPLILAIELEKHLHSTNNAERYSIISSLIPRIIQRVDELTNIVGYFILANNRTETKKLNKFPNSLKHSLRLCLETKFDAHQFAKYNRTDRQVTLKDLIFLCHPSSSSNEERQKLFDDIINDTLEAPFTWEVELSKLGQVKYHNEEEKKKAVKNKWEELIDSKKLGYMATLRNLRNMLNADVSSKHIEKVSNFLSNPNAVLNSKQLPFRFYSAYKMLVDNDNPKTSIVLEALNSAIWESVKNIPGIDEEDNVLIAADDSGSMTWDNITPTISRYEVGILLAVLLRKRCKSVTLGRFSNHFRISQIPENENVLSAVKAIGDACGGGTFGWKVAEYLNDSNYSYDKIFMFSDMQLWEDENNYRYTIGEDRTDITFSSLWKKYIKKSPNSELFMFDLAGYGTTPVSINSSGVFIISGWSDKIFEVLASLKNGAGALDMIKKITF